MLVPIYRWVLRQAIPISECGRQFIILVMPTERNDTLLLDNIHLFRTYCSNLNSYRLSLEENVWKFRSLHLRPKVKMQDLNPSSYPNTGSHLSQKFDVFQLGTWRKLRKVTIIFAISVCLSVPPHGTTRLSLDRLFIEFDISVQYSDRLMQLLIV
jgi:hypothetical protein